MFALSKWLSRAAAAGIAVGMLVTTPQIQAQDQRGGGTLGSPEPSPQTLPALPVPKKSVTTEPAAQGDKRKSAPPQAKLLDPVACTVAAEQPKSAWYNNPPYSVIPRPGNFYVPPTGCGYYSLLDVLTGELRQAPPKNAYPDFCIMPFSFYDADFRYVDDPNYDPDFLERLHRIHIGDDWLFGTGGQAQWRHMHEFSSRLTGKTNDYDLFRMRVFGDLWYKDTFRIYAELISAGTANQDLPPARIDENRIDFQNLFFDLKVAEFDCHPAYLRVGRQEMLLGSQRVISPLDWANTRRTFEGARGLWSNEHFDLTAFWLQPVIPDNAGWSSVDHNQNFYGAWGTYRPRKGTAVDLYYLFLDNANHTTAAGIVTAPTSVHTLGTRYSGDKCGFLWDAEGMLQLGSENGKPIHAGSATGGLGYNAKNLPMNPTVWAYYDWASGDSSPNKGDYTTFNQLFPFGHYYFGFLDLVGRQNIRDWNFHLYLNPAKWVTFNAQYHFFSLDKAEDGLYNAGAAPIRVNTKGAAGGVVGQELDVFLNFHLTFRSDVLVGYSKLNAGEFISNTGNGRSPELFYLMYNVRW